MSSLINKRVFLLSAVVALVALTICAVLLVDARSPGQWVDRTYIVSFRWNAGLKSIRIVDSAGNSETNPVLQRVVLRESRDAAAQIVNLAALSQADGHFGVTLDGSSEPYLMYWSGADIPQLDKLMDAAAAWDLDEVRKIIGEGMSVNARALDSRNTPLILAASDPTKLFSSARLARFKKPPDSRTVPFLLTAGANPNLRGYLGATALMRANNLSIAKALINDGADVNARDDDGRSALVYAIKSRNGEILQLLIDARADVNTRDKSGSTPLMYAVDEGNLTATKRLLSSGADAGLTNDQGESPLLIARERRSTPGEAKIIQLLSNAVAKPK